MPHLWFMRYSTFFIAGLLLVSLLYPSAVAAEQVAVRYREGSVHGFLAMRDTEGKVVATGDLTQVVKGERVTSHMVFRFRDGSLDDDTAVFTQHGKFRLISDHHIQKGPTFKEPNDVLIETATGQVTVKYWSDRKEKVDTNHLDLPADLANGFIINLLKNIPRNAHETKLSWLATTPKPRLVTFLVTPTGENNYSIGGMQNNAGNRLDVKIELGGITGVIAPLVGKQPSDIFVWLSGGEPPAFLKLVGPQYLGGPLCTIELASPVWP